jgi:hypothetical protein
MLEIGVSPGPEMGRILRHVYEQQLEGRVATLEDAIAQARTVLSTND